ncbi:MAG TPA: hypothetical protein PKC24_15210 [Cyclobacteriaceae bacterium]|nr:hypothetical protein [Cyclobacteriaceae bacterium]
MNPLPAATETIVLGISAEKAQTLLFKATLNNEIEVQDYTSRKYFIGEVGVKHFRISLKIEKPNNFIPIIKGHFESASNGSLLFLNYSLFQSTRVYLIFWSCFALVCSIVAFFVSENYGYSLIALFALGLIQWVAWGNFQIQLKKSRAKLLEVIK